MGSCTYFEKSKRRYFLFVPLPYPRDRTASNNFRPPEPKGWTCPRGCLGVGDGNTKIELPVCIRASSRVASSRTYAEDCVT